MNETDSLTSKQKKATFGVVFLTIFMDMVGFSVIFPLFPSMLDHYLLREGTLGGGMVTSFVEMIKGYGYQGDQENNFNLETVILRSAWFALCNSTICICTNMGRFSDRVGGAKFFC